jgi:hypothetical protein
MNDWRIGKDLEGYGRGLIEVLSRHFLVGIEENHENLNQDIRTEHLPNTSLESFVSRAVCSVRDINLIEICYVALKV